jgi:hypothetical protein
MAKILTAGGLMKRAQSSFSGTSMTTHRPVTNGSLYCFQWRFPADYRRCQMGSSSFFSELMMRMISRLKAHFYWTSRGSMVTPYMSHSALRRDLSREFDVYKRIGDQEERSIAYEFAPAKNPGLYLHVPEI